MSYEFYKVLHLSALFVTLISLGGATVHVLNGGTREFKNRRLLTILHGVGLVLVLISGFGAAAKLQLLSTGLPSWIYVKLALWLTVGALPAVIYRMRKHAMILLIVTWILFSVGAFVAVNKYNF